MSIATGSSTLRCCTLEPLLKELLGASSVRYTAFAGSMRSAAHLLKPRSQASTTIALTKDSGNRVLCCKGLNFLPTREKLPSRRQGTAEGSAGSLSTHRSVPAQINSLTSLIQVIAEGTEDHG